MRPNVLLFIGAALLMGPRCWAGPTECGTLTPPPPGAFSPSDPVVEARIVFVAFKDNGPDQPETLPMWKDEMVSKLHDFFFDMSRGAQQLNVSILEDPTALGMAWITQHPASYYASPQAPPPGQFGLANREIMQQIATKISNPWQNVDMVFMVHYQCTSCPAPYTNDPQACEDNCSFGGDAILGFVPEPGEYSGAGVTVRVYHWPQLNWTYGQKAAPWVAAHEYGHWLTLIHTPGSVPITDHPEEYVNAGRYDVMRSGSGGVVTIGGLASYAGLQLTDPDINWVQKETITTDTEGIHIGDIRGPNAKVVEVPVPGSTQSFVLVNYQGTSPFDQVYGNEGLLIWHILRTPLPEASNVAWDLESARGKTPNAETGMDPLEAYGTDMGTPADFFDGSAEVSPPGTGRRNFSCSTNPNTNLYEQPLYASAQSIKTKVAFENIRPDPLGTGDMLVDVFFKRTQKVVTPNGGEIVLVGQPLTIDWAERPFACIANVDVKVSSNGGASFTTIGPNEANDGLFTWTPASTGTQYRVQILSRDQWNGTETDDSDANFTVADELIPPAASVLTVDPVKGRNSLIVTWIAPGDDGTVGQATAYDFRYSVSPINAGNFLSATQLTTAPVPSPAGTPECAELSGLQWCRLYYCALKTRDEWGNWSTMSNVASGATKCSGNTQVACAGGGMFAMGGGGGSGWQPLNSLLESTAPGEKALDQLRLSQQPTEEAGSFGLQVLWTGKPEIEISKIGLVTVDHSKDLKAWWPGSGVILGTLAPVSRISTASGEDITKNFAGDGPAYVGAAGEELYVHLSDQEATGKTLLVEAAGRGVKTNDTAGGLLIQVPGPSDQWETIAHYHPRYDFDQFVLDYLKSSLVRIVCLGQYQIRSIAEVKKAGTGVPETATLAGAEHSRLGSVSASAATLVKNDRLALRFNAKSVPADKVRDWFLQVEGTAGKPPVEAAKGSVVQSELPKPYALFQNQPNPFSNATTFRFALAQGALVRLEVFDLLGRQVATVANGWYPGGSHAVEWNRRVNDGGQAVPGVYVYRLRAGGFQSLNKMVLLPAL